MKTSAETWISGYSRILNKIQIFLSFINIFSTKAIVRINIQIKPDVFKKQIRSQNASYQVFGTYNICLEK